MGNKFGKGSVSKSDLKRFKQMGIVFEPSEIQILNAHFTSICQQQTSGAASSQKQSTMNREQFKEALGFQGSLYTDRIFQMFDDDGDGEIVFEEFLIGMNTLSEKGGLADKVAFSFEIFDFDGDGKISREELGRMLQASLKESEINLDDALIAAVVESTFREVNPKDTNFIEMDEYKNMIEKKGSDHLLHIDVKQRIAAVRERLVKRKRKSKFGGR